MADVRADLERFCMSIEMYAEIIIRVYAGLFLLSVLAAAVGIWKRIRKKTFKFWWTIPCSMLYSIFAAVSTSTAYIAYDDIADPNYPKFKDWKLLDFVLNDIKMLALWLFIGVVLCLIFARKECRKSIKIGCAVLLIISAVVFLAIMALSFTKFS